MLWKFVQRFSALCVLLLVFPVLFVCTSLVFVYDRKNPFYISKRVGSGGKIFAMIKLRTMVADADRGGVIATALTDARITPVGRLLRWKKLDEFFQLVNVIKGDMLLIGPRPQLLSEYLSFTRKEMKIVSAMPGISDFASLFLSDQERLLAGSEDPYDTYLHICRPIKSRLALFYVEHRSVWVDCVLLFFNATNFISHRWTLRHMAKFIVKLGDCGVPYEVLSGEKEPYPMDLPR